MDPTRHFRHFRQLMFTLMVAGSSLLSGCGGGGDASPTLASIEVTPANPSLAAGTGIQLSATGIYSDQSHKDLTSQVAWTSSAASVASVDANGLASSAAPGTTTFSATTGAIVGKTQLTVTPAIVASISITPALPSIAAGTSQKFVATALMTDKTTQDISTQMTWSSSDDSLAGVDTSGNAHGMKAGLPTISATCSLASLCGTRSATVQLKVTAATLVSLAVTPGTSSAPAGTTQAMAAVGTFTDQSQQDLTGQVTWSSSANSAATISNAVGSAGLVTAISPNATTLTASLGDVSAQAVLTVTNATLVSITATPGAPADLPLGLSQQFRAIGTYTDGSLLDLTTNVTWFVDNASIATLSNASGSNGMATPTAVGATNVIAVLNGVVSGPSALNVVAARLTSIALTSNTTSLNLATTQQYTAVGTYTDQTTRDVTATATWATSNASIASVSNAAGSQGLLSARTVGTTNLTAAQNDVTSAPLGITVSAPVGYSQTTAGAFSWTVPAGVTQVVVYGAGGGAGGTSSPAGYSRTVQVTITVAPGDVISGSVGAGGTAGNTGEDTTIQLTDGGTTTPVSLSPGGGTSTTPVATSNRIGYALYGSYANGGAANSAGGDGKVTITP